jgi:hypothetical protein
VSALRIVVVLGMHRSGTSAIARAVKAAGVDFGDDLMPSAPGNNEKGFWEDQQIRRLNDRLLAALGCDWSTVRWIDAGAFAAPDLQALREEACRLLDRKFGGATQFGFKDPRASRLLPFWQDVFRRLSLDERYVIALRNPLSVEKSLAARDGLDAEHSQMLWLDHLVPLVNHTEGRARLFIDYDRMLDEPQKEVRRLAAFLGAASSDEREREMEHYAGQFLSDGLRHSKFEASVVEAAPHVRPEVADAYRVLRPLAELEANQPIEVDAARWHAITDAAKVLIDDYKTPPRPRPPLSFRRASVVAGCVCAASLAYAQYVEPTRSSASCAGCLVQRALLATLLAIFVLGAMRTPAHLTARLYAGCATLLALAGAAIAANGLWMKGADSGAWSFAVFTLLMIHAGWLLVRPAPRYPRVPGARAG